MPIHKKTSSKIKIFLVTLLAIATTAAWTFSFWAQNYIDCSGTMSAEKGVSAVDIHWCKSVENLYQGSYVYTGYSKSGLGLIGYFFMSKILLIAGIISFILLIIAITYTPKTKPQKQIDLPQE